MKSTVQVLIANILKVLMEPGMNSFKGKIRFFVVNSTFVSKIESA